MNEYLYSGSGSEMLPKLYIMTYDMTWAWAYVRKDTRQSPHPHNIFYRVNTFLLPTRMSDERRNVSSSELKTRAYHSRLLYTVVVRYILSNIYMSFEVRASGQES